MTTTDLDILTDKVCKTDNTSFSTGDKLLYYNIGYGLLNGLIIDEQEDTNEREYTHDTVAGHSDYKAKARLHHINSLKIDYGQGFITARYKSEQDLISEYGDVLQTTLTGWSSSDPIYNYKGDHFFVYPAPTVDQAGEELLKASFELLPADLTPGDTPRLPENVQPGLSGYAGMMVSVKPIQVISSELRTSGRE